MPITLWHYAFFLLDLGLLSFYWERIINPNIATDHRYEHGVSMEKRLATLDFEKVLCWKFWQVYRLTALHKSPPHSIALANLLLILFN